MVEEDVAVPAPRSWDRPAVTVPVFAALAAVGGQFPGFTRQANLFILAVGAVFVWVGLAGWVRQPARLPIGWRPHAVWWLLPVAVFGVLESATFLLGSSDNYPTFSRLADPLLEREVVRSVGYFGWLAAFWGLVRR